MKSLNQKTQMLILLGLVFMLNACGAHKSEEGNSSFASRVSIDSALSPAVNSAAICNMKATPDYQFKLKAVIGNNGQLDSTKVFLKFSQLPKQFKEGLSAFFFWKWKAYSLNGSEKTEIDQSPLYFQIIDPKNWSGLTGLIRSVTWTDVEKMATKMELTTPEQFFSYVIIAIDLGSNGLDYEALKVSQYEQGTTKYISSTDALIPTFNANPVDYMTEPDGVSARPEILNKLHPFAGMSLSTPQYKATSDKFCF